jgi:hypothetical protein
MKWATLILTGVLSIVGYSNSKQEITEFVATLPNGATVELIGLSYHSPGAELSEPKRWWRPDGSDLPDEPYRHPRRGTGTGGDYYAREFSLRITSVDGYSCATYNSLGRSNVQPVVPLNEKNESVPGVLAFVCRFNNSQFKDTIRIGVSTEPWQKVEEWTDESWDKHDPDNIVFPKSKHPLILTWPRQKGRAVILEMVCADKAEGRRMLLFDRDEHCHEELPRIHGEGPGLVKEQYWFWNIQREDMYRLEFQRRAYQWVEFRNVSLQPAYKTNVEVAVLAMKDKLAEGLAVSTLEKESIGYILHSLAANLPFPAKGRATYQIEERSAWNEEPRILQCKYVFDGVLYGLEVTGRDLNVGRYFDGEKTTRWEPLSRVATIQAGKRDMTPIYRLEQFCPTKIVEDLLGHEVELKGSGTINGISCSLLDCVISAKDRLKVWVSKQPDVYPLRIERYEHDVLRHVYESENIRLWNGVVFPEKITEASYRPDDVLQYSLISSSVVTVESFVPGIYIAAKEFAPEFPPGTSMSKHDPAEPQASDFEPTFPHRHVRQFADIDIEFNISQAKGKMILLCFFDLNQRPSRYLVAELAKKADELGDKGVALVAVQASKIDEKALDGWVKKYSIPFPVGMVKDDLEGIKARWGVRSLPWLILADRRHHVVAAGFGLSELDQKIKEAQNGNR